MSTQTPADDVLIHDQTPLLHPIRVPAQGLMDIHQETNEKLEAFLEEHLKRFPQRAAFASVCR